MDPLSISAASGMRARMESLDMLANNLANATTVGYKSDREFYSLYASADAAADSFQTPEGADTVPVIESHWTDLAQGVIRNTGNTLDMAIDGQGFFSVKGPNGTLFTRNGNFRSPRTAPWSPPMDTPSSIPPVQRFNPATPLLSRSHPTVP